LANRIPNFIGCPLRLAGGQPRADVPGSLT
jgi:hypothetical protein